MPQGIAPSSGLGSKPRRGLGAGRSNPFHTPDSSMDQARGSGSRGLSDRGSRNVQRSGPGRR
eukprot:3872441-Rhodomonas_salina.3